jgi:hypothetical protein
LTNIFLCTFCNTQVIAEELIIHQCKQVLERKIDDNILWLKDDERWYPLKRRQPQVNTNSITDKVKKPSKQTTKIQQPERTPDDSTESIIDVKFTKNRDNNFINPTFIHNNWCFER